MGISVKFLETNVLVSVRKAGMFKHFRRMLYFMHQNSSYFLEQIEEIQNFISIWFLSLRSRDPGDINIVAGDVLLDRSSCTSVRRSVSAIFMHKDYNQNLENDIAIIRVCHCNLPSMGVRQLLSSSAIFSPVHGLWLTVFTRTNHWKSLWHKPKQPSTS
jgi:hypothetical protein